MQINELTKQFVDNRSMTYFARYMGKTVGTVTAFLAAIVIMSSSALPQTEKWETDLATQLQSEHKCTLNYLTSTRNFILLGRETLETKAHCIDGRAFDATRSDDPKQFDIKKCSPDEC
jgi:hypothetical protein